MINYMTSDVIKGWLPFLLLVNSNLMPHELRSKRKHHHSSVSFIVTIKAVLI